jgi:putative RecB family exonuclease
MKMNTKLNDLKDELHISHSQVFTYKTCSLKYFFNYVEKRPAESVSIALPFGSAIHTVLDLYYRALKNGREPESLDTMSQFFEETLTVNLESFEVPLLYNKSMPDSTAALEMGKTLVETFYNSVDLSGFEVVDVELPMSATLYTEDGQATDFKLVGVVDLILRNGNGDLLIVDNKTAARSYSQSSADDDTQMSAYSYLMATNKFVPLTSSVECRFDVLLKLKTKPRLQQVYTIRTREDRRRFAKVANAVLAGIDAKIFFPQPSWMCSGCQFTKACLEW